MTDHIFLQLNDQFALAADDLQWILVKRHLRRNKADSWDGVSFVRTTRDILLRCMWEKGCFPTAEAQVALSSLPSSFDAWKAAQPSCAVPPEPVSDAEPAITKPAAVEAAEPRGRMSTLAADYEARHRNCSCHEGPIGARRLRERPVDAVPVTILA